MVRTVFNVDDGYCANHGEHQNVEGEERYAVQLCDLEKRRRDRQALLPRFFVRPREVFIRGTSLA